MDYFEKKPKCKTKYLQCISLLLALKIIIFVEYFFTLLCVTFIKQTNKEKLERQRKKKDRQLAWVKLTETINEINMCAIQSTHKIRYIYCKDADNDNSNNNNKNKGNLIYTVNGMIYI